MITVKVYLYPQDNCQLISFCDARGHFHYMICNTDSSNNLLGLHISIIMVTHSFHSYRLRVFGTPSIEIVLVAKLMTQGRGKQQKLFRQHTSFLLTLHKDALPSKNEYSKYSHLFLLGMTRAFDNCDMLLFKVKPTSSDLHTSISDQTESLNLKGRGEYIAGRAEGRK